jgi:RNA polymerase sigma-70 factor (ECF subfamily)
MSMMETIATAPLVGTQEAMQQLREVMRGLPTEEKMVFLLRQNAELTYEQIAQLRNRSVDGVKDQMRNALRKLRAVFQEIPSGYHARCS